MHVRFDRDGAVEGSGEGAGDFPVTGAGVDEDLSFGQVVHQPLQQPLRVPFLVGVVEKNLKSAFVILALRVKHPNGFRLCHGRFPVMVVAAAAGGAVSEWPSDFFFRRFVKNTRMSRTESMPTNFPSCVTPRCRIRV